MVVATTCPACTALVRRWVSIPFVFFRTICTCGSPVIIRNPQVTDDFLRTARRCLDCGDPILPPKPKGRVPRVPTLLPRPHPWICESCRERHKMDEPGTDLDSEIKAWLRGHPPLSRTAARRSPSL